jgi:hypothetical protein
MSHAHQEAERRLQIFLARVFFRARARRALALASWLVLIGCGAAVAFAVAGLFGWPLPWNWCARHFVPLAATVGVVSVGSLAWPLPRARIVAEADRELGLEAALLTCRRLLDSDHPFRDVLLEHTAARLENEHPSRALPLRLPPALPLAPALVSAAALLAPAGGAGDAVAARPEVDLRGHGGDRVLSSTARESRTASASNRGDSRALGSPSSTSIPSHGSMRRPLAAGARSTPVARAGDTAPVSGAFESTNASGDGSRGRGAAAGPAALTRGPARAEAAAAGQRVWTLPAPTRAAEWPDGLGAFPAGREVFTTPEEQARIDAYREALRRLEGARGPS